jgi:formylglycine-generating enzyme
MDACKLINLLITQPKAVARRYTAMDSSIGNFFNENKMKQILLILFVICNALIIDGKAQNIPYPVIVRIEGGTYTMGSNSSEAGNEEKPAHSVTVKSFGMSKYEITVAQYRAFCNTSGLTMPDAPFWGWKDKHPMAMVSFDDAIAYCNWLSEETGKTYRLPTEAEWEYAACGGGRSHGYNYAGSDSLDEVGWNSNNAGGQTQVAGSKNPNELGLYDMSGNVWEWCSDWYDESYYSKSPSTNPKGPSSRTYRVLRGGSWDDDVDYCRITCRNHDAPGNRNFNYGFRVVISDK